MISSPKTTPKNEDSSNKNEICSCDLFVTDFSFICWDGCCCRSENKQTLPLILTYKQKQKWTNTEKNAKQKLCCYPFLIEFESKVFSTGVFLQIKTLLIYSPWEDTCCSSLVLNPPEQSRPVAVPGGEQCCSSIVKWFLLSLKTVCIALFINCLPWFVLFWMCSGCISAIWGQCGDADEPCLLHQWYSYC